MFRLRVTQRIFSKLGASVLPKAIKLYVRYVEAVNYRVGRFALYLVFLMIGILIVSAASRSFFNIPFSWAIELAQFTLATYYLLGGAYTLQNNAHVRMDLLYERWSVKKRAFADSITAFCLIFYLGVLLYGGYSSTSYALQYGQKNYSAWAPYMSPIKIIMTVGIFLMLLQAIAQFFRDLATVQGKEIS